jgi:DNA-binding protein H-NS
MASLSNMNLEALMNLRNQVDRRLLECRAEIEKQLQRMDGAITGRQRNGSLKGTRVSPKYRSPSGETWAGRGAKPRWLVAAVKSGKKIDDFLIDKSARKRRRSKR